MNGVEVLSSTQVATEYAFNWNSFWVVFGIMCGIAVIASVFYVVADICEWQIIPVCLVIGAILGVLIGVASGYIHQTPINYETQYEVIISDEVSMNEFYEHYEIIKQNGKIFTVREKE